MLRKQKVKLMGFLLTAVLSLGVGNSSELEPATLQEVLDMAKTRNPEIAAAKSGWSAARSRITVARGIPDLEFGVEYEGIHRNSLDPGSAQSTQYRVGQTIPFPTKIYYKSRAATFESEREEQAYRSTEWEILSRVKEAYFALLFADRAVQISKENVEILRKFARIAANRYAVGKASQSDVLRAQVELSKANNRVVTVEQEFLSAQARLNSLLDRKPHEPFGNLEEPVPAPLPKTYEELEAVAFRERPLIQEAKSQIQMTAAEVNVTKSELLPDLGIEYAWRNMSLAPNDSSLSFKLNVPLWFWRQKGEIGAAKSERIRAGEILRSVEADTRSDLQEFIVHVDTAQRLVELYRTTLLPQAEQSLRIAEAAYQSDRIDFLNLLDSDRTLIDFRLEYYRNLAEYGKNVAHLERVLGVRLEQLKGKGS